MGLLLGEEDAKTRMSPALRSRYAETMGFSRAFNRPNHLVADHQSIAQDPARNLHQVFLFLGMHLSDTVLEVYRCLSVIRDATMVDQPNVTGDKFQEWIRPGRRIKSIGAGTGFRQISSNTLSDRDDGCRAFADDVTPVPSGAARPTRGEGARRTRIDASALSGECNGVDAVSRIQKLLIHQHQQLQDFPVPD